MNGVPNGIRTRVLAVKGQCPRPLDYGDAQRPDSAYQIYNLQYLLLRAVKFLPLRPRSALEKTLVPSRARLFLVLFSIAFGALLLSYATVVEPYWIEITHHDLDWGLKHPITVAQLSDVHLEGFGRREHALIEILRRDPPDVIVFTGDLTASRPDYQSLARFLQELHPRLGLWGVPGNWDHARRPPRPDFFAHLNVHWMVNQAARLTDELWVLGLDDEVTGRPALTQTLAQVPTGVHTLALFHSPSFFDHLSSKVSLALAGHTHAGQVRLPGMAPLWLPVGSGRFVEGWYSSPRAKLYVSRGIGTSLLPIRFNCRPEVPFFRLH
jgi:uncharacterized protein